MRRKSAQGAIYRLASKAFRAEIKYQAPEVQAPPAIILLRAEMTSILPGRTITVGTKIVHKDSGVPNNWLKFDLNGIAQHKKVLEQKHAAALKQVGQAK